MKEKYLIWVEGEDYFKSIRIVKDYKDIPVGFWFIDLSEKDGMFLPGQSAWKQLKENVYTV